MWSYMKSNLKKPKPSHLKQEQMKNLEKKQKFSFFDINFSYQ